MQGGRGALRVVAIESTHLVDEHIALTVVARDEACTHRRRMFREVGGSGRERAEGGVRKGRDS
jgi:hypothetical protein